MPGSSTPICAPASSGSSARAQLFDPRVDRRRAPHRRRRWSGLEEADDFVARATSAFALSREPIDAGWYAELSQVSAVAADIAGVTSTHINHLTPRVLDIDELYRRMTARGIAMIDAIQGPPRWAGPDVLLRQTSFRALAEPRRFRDSEGTVTEGSLRVRFGEVEARGVALTRKGRERYDAAMAAPDPAAVWDRYFPATDAELAAQGLAYYRGGDPAKPVVYEDFLPASAAGIFRSNLDTRRRRPPTCPTTPTTATTGWQARSAITSTTLTTSTRKRHHDHHANERPAHRRRAARPRACGAAGHRRPHRSG